ncbi:MAG: hypothetical protein L0Z54_06105 [Thermoplasmata archaeon]|nr:hypothetical protein [Thermoplasmata archaeon]
MRPEPHERLIGILASYRSKSLRQRAELGGMAEQMLKVHELGDIYAFEMKPVFDEVREELKRYSYDMEYKEDVDWNNGLLIVDLNMGIGFPPDGSREGVPGMRYTLSAHRGDVTIEFFERGFDHDGRTHATLRFDQIDRGRVANQVMDLLEHVCEVQLVEEKAYYQEQERAGAQNAAETRSEPEFSIDESDAATRIAKFRSRTRRK